MAKADAGLTFKNLLNQSRQIIYSLYQENEIIKILYSNITNSIKL